MIAIAGTVTVAPERRDDLLTATVEPQRAVRDEPGCLAYAFSADPVDAGVVRVFELWADAEALEAHFVHPNFAVMRGVLGRAGITGATIEKYRIDARGPVVGPDGVPTSQF